MKLNKLCGLGIGAALLYGLYKIATEEDEIIDTDPCSDNNDEFFDGYGDNDDAVEEKIQKLQASRDIEKNRTKDIIDESLSGCFNSEDKDYIKELAEKDNKIALLENMIKELKKKIDGDNR